jgi:hypothetical protein
MGYASTFDQLGQNVEMAATAQSKIIVDMFTDPAKYAKIAGVEVGTFSKLLKTDANEAFIKFLEGLNGNNQGLSEMATKLDDLGIDGARATQALASLSSNTKMLREQQVLANDAMTKGTSLNTEYAIKNENLAGSWEKVSAFIHSKFINSGLLAFLEKIIGKTAEMIEQPVEAKLRAEQSELNILVAAITNVNTTQENRNDLMAEIQKKYPDFLVNLNAEKVTNEELRTRLEDVNKQYEDRILLMIKEDMLAKNYRERTELKIKELDLIKQIGAAETIAAAARKKITPGMDANSYRNVLTQKEFDAMRDLPILTAALQENRDKVTELKAAETDLNNALGELRKNRTGSPVGGTTADNSSVTTPDIPVLDQKELDKIKDKAYKDLEISNRKELNLIKQHQVEVNATEEEYKKALEEEEINGLNKKLALQIKYGDDYSDTMAAILDKQLKQQEDIDKKTEEEKKKSLKKELDDLDNQQKNALALAKKDALAKGMTEEETNALLITKEIEFLNQKLILEQKYGQDTVETTAAITAKLNELAENALKADEDRLKELSDIKNKYDDDEITAKEERDNALAALDKAQKAGLIKSEEEYIRLKTNINKKYEQSRLEKAIDTGQKISQVVSLGSNLVKTLMDAELAKAGDNEEKKAQIKKKYANKQFLMAASEIVVNTAVAIMQGFAQLGPIGGAISAVLLTATGIAQLAIANAERKKMQGFYSGGPTGTGDKRKVAGNVHFGEYVIPEEGYNAPGIRPVVDLIEIARRNGSLARLDLRPVVASIGTGKKGYSGGGLAGTSSTSESNSPIIVSGVGIDSATLNRFSDSIDRLTKWKPTIYTELVKKDLDTLEKINKNRGM